jgi:hypothetical protein
MGFCDSIKNDLGYDVGIYNIHGNYIDGKDLGFRYTDDIEYGENSTYIRFKNYIIVVNSKLSQDACNLIKLAYNIVMEKEAANIVQPLEYILKNNVSQESIKDKYTGYNVFYIWAKESILDILNSIYEGYEGEIVQDFEGVYFVKKMEDPEQEADSIINGIRQESGASVIIGCGRTVGGKYTIKDAANHAKTACTIAKNLQFKEGFYSIDKILVYGLIDSLEEDKINYYLNGGYSGFLAVINDKELVDTADELFECNLNISEASRKLYVHRNTLLYRIEKIKNLTGLDIKKFDEALIFKVIVAVYKLKKR